MKLTWNWGTGIAVFYIIFASILIFLVIKSTTYDRSLVVDNYYEEDLAYQQKYDKRKNSLALAQPLAIKYNKKEALVELQFPTDIGQLGGTIQLYRPSSQAMDQVFQVASHNEGKVVIPATNLAEGLWKVRVDWTAGDKAYFDEKQIFL